MFLLFFIFVICTTLALSSYQAVCDSAFCRILDNSLKEVNELQKLVDQGVCVESFGTKADTICSTVNYNKFIFLINQALEQFTSEAAPEDEESEKLYDKKVEYFKILINNYLTNIYIH